jgi:glycosyltransferase involved in cell wall biosynthesis
MDSNPNSRPGLESGLVVVVPAYNAERFVAGVIERLRALRGLALRHIVVVDDGSRDATRAEVLACQTGAIPVELVSHDRNRGYGAAMKSGLSRARELGANMVACVHADGQYSPEVLPELVLAMQSRALDLLQGSRVASGTALSGGMPLYKYVGNALLNHVENATLKLGMTDYHSGYLLYGTRALAQLPFTSLSNSFDFDLEVIALASARGLCVGETPIPTHYGDEISHLNPLTYGMRVLRVMWNYRRGRYDDHATA